MKLGAEKQLISLNIFSEGGNVCCYKKCQITQFCRPSGHSREPFTANKQSHSHQTGPFKELTIVKQ